MDELLSLIQPEPWSRLTVALIAAMAFSRGLSLRLDRHAQAGA